MRMYKCFAVDDDDLALKLLKDFVEKTDELAWVSGFDDPLKAQVYLEKESIDILFLDVHMPNLNGLELYKSLHRKPATIVSSSFPDYALEGFQLDMVDYILKPYSYTRFEQAIRKATDFLVAQEAKDQHDFFWIKVEYQMVKVFFHEIKYIESAKQYVHIHTDTGTLISLNSLKHIDSLLPKGLFARIHKSYLVSRQRIIKKTHAYVVVDDQIIPVGRTYKENLLLS